MDRLPSIETATMMRTAARRLTQAKLALESAEHPDQIRRCAAECLAAVDDLAEASQAAESSIAQTLATG